MRRKKENIGYKKERVILSDVLPYELPITFSNRHFYDFLLEHKVEVRKGSVYWRQEGSTLDTVIRLLLGVENSVPVVTEATSLYGSSLSINRFERLGSKFFAAIPFSYKIRHKEHEFRELAVCHPRNQLQLVEFYDSYKELILYYCGVSPFSIRRPTRVSRFVFHKDKMHYSSLSDETVGVEEADKEYENLRSFFVYKDYSYILKFYEDYKFHRCEKKYNKLVKLDIAKCFDSIYTHSLPWALLSKESVKENLESSKKTFGGKFDGLMQQTNYNETNGIIIGPEFSRIFAEIILQSVDRSVCSELERVPHEQVHRRDYEIFRYVDDYFVFYNDDKCKEYILRVLQFKLKEHKLYLNSSKAVIYEKPIITNISIAKHKIRDLLTERLAYKIERVTTGATDSVKDGLKPGGKKGSIQINSNALVTYFKTIIKESGVEYKDTLTYTLSIVERRCIQIIRDYRSLGKDEKSERHLVQATYEICDFTFFIYSASPRVNTTIRLCRILHIFIFVLKGKEFSPDLRHSVCKLIYDNIGLILRKNRDSEHTPVETLYLLIALSELGGDYRLDVDTLCSYFRIKVQNNTYSLNASLNYISLVVLLFYIRDRSRYSGLRNAIEEAIIRKFKERSATLRKDTELTLLLLDCLTCPYLKTTTKKAILGLYGIVDDAIQESVINYRKYWFTKWSDFDFGQELDAKRSQEVY